MHQEVPTLPGDSPIALLYRQHAPKIFDYVRTHLSSFEDAEDILVEVFVAALENKRFLALSEREQQAWLWRVARNKVVDVYRHATRLRSVPISALDETMFEHEAANPEQVSMRQVEDKDLHMLINDLSPLQQEILRLRFNDNLRCNQIASRIGKRHGTVRSILSRTLNHLRRLCEQQEKGDVSDASTTARRFHILDGR